MLLSTGMGYLYYSEFSSFYNQSDENIRLYDTQGLKIFYANILYTNADFKSLQKTIEIENPDIVILVEFSDAHEQEMKDFFQERYPYINRNSWSNTLAGNVIFSKYPLTNLMENYISNKGSRSYGYVNVDCKNVIQNCGENGINLYVIHTAAPVSLDNFHIRNEQLQKLSNDFKGNNNENPTIIIGDFNVSPWSYYYSDLVASLGLKNALSFQSPNYTWSLMQKKVFCSHIDQLFVSDQIKISEIQISDLSGSDHRSFSFNVGLN